MPRFAANLSMMFNEVAFLDRFQAAADAGFRGVEFLFPYEHPKEIVAEKLKSAGLANVLFNLPPGDFAKGERGLAALAGREEEFRAAVDLALEYAEALGTPCLHAMAGLRQSGADRGVYVRNLKYAASKCESAGRKLLIEPINTRDIPGYFLNTQAEAWAVCEEVGSAALRMQMDLYHIQIVEGDLEMKLRKYFPRCAHVQVAGVPERHEPDRGEVNYPHLFRVLDELGYTGWVGCEYRPAGNTLDGLGWVRPYLR